MKVHEYVGKKILRDYGLKVPRSVLVTRIEDYPLAESVGFPQVLKAQVLVGGRMKAGGVVFSNSIDETKEKLRQIIGKQIKGEVCRKVLVEEVFEHTNEEYLSIILDRNERDIFFVYSQNGGINIEENNDSIRKIRAKNIEKLPKHIRAISETLLKVFVEKDLTLLEINPIGFEMGDYMLLDCVMHLDESALFRQTWYDVEEHSEYQKSAAISGDVAVIGCGAGIVMATFDAVTEAGKRVGFFKDLGGGVTKEETLEILRSLPKNISTLVANIFGGITDTVEIAKAIVEFNEEKPEISLYVRITGTNEVLAKNILNINGIEIFNSTLELVNALRGEKDVLES